MIRTHSHSFKPYGSFSIENKMLKSTLGFGFRTLWKDRDTHQLSTQTRKGQKSKKNDQPSPNHSTTSQRESAHQQEMKAFIKMMKKNSNESETISKPIEIPNKKLSCQSSRSIHLETRSMNESGVFNGPEGPAVLTLDELEKKIEELIQIRLKKKSKEKNFFNSQILEDDVDRELRMLVKEVRNYNRVNTNSSLHEEEIRNDDSLDVSIKEISQKINIIEKVIAETYTSSEIMKKYYSASKNRTTKNHSLSTSKVTPIKTCLQNSSFINNQSKVPSIHFETTSKNFVILGMSSYVKPPRASYSLEKYQQAPYLANRQPIPRSNYQREFLYYGVVPTYSTKLDNSSVCTDTGISMKNRISNYQSEFREKKAKLVDSNTLDCRQDKFKYFLNKYRNPKISFMPSRQAMNAEELKRLQKNSKKLDNILTKAQPKVFALESSMNKENNSTTTGICLKTEQKEKFLGKKCTIESYMKDKNLLKLKYSYKLNYNA